ncbi:MAG: ComEC/Rec2 family competence protein [Candidatus Aegiribacteria sp.]|nr:ComEC/Rec2 family competence protein [Candidatus Aegiribacteria sp.]
MILGKLLFSITSLFLLGYYLPFRVEHQLWMIPAVIGLIAAIAGYRKYGMLLLCASSLLVGLYWNNDHLSKHDEESTESARVGVWSCNVETSTTRGALLLTESGRQVWSSDKELAQTVRRGDYVLVLGSMRGNFLETWSFSTIQSNSLQNRIRRVICRRWREKLHSRQTSSLVSALLAGERGTIPTHTRNIFEITGTSHLLAVSGLHVGIICAIILIIARRIFGKTWLSVFITILLMCSYVFIAGARASTVRAGIMGMFILIAWQAVGKTPDILFIWAFAVIVLIILSSGAVLNDIGAQMSFSAVLSLIIFGRNFRGNIWKKILSVFYAGVVVTLSLAPLISCTFGAVSPVAPIATVISLPFMLTLMALGVISLSWGFIASGASILAEWTVYIWLKLLYLLEFRRFEFKEWMLVIWFAGIIMLLLFSRRRGFFRRFR